MSKNVKLKVEISPPENGWTHIKLMSNNSPYEFFPSDVPIDSISEWINAILGILDGKTLTEVYWNDEPVIHKFLFSYKNKLCYFDVFEVSGSKQIERFSYNGTKYNILLSFWKALTYMRSKQTSKEYKFHWGNDFPENDLLEIEQKLRILQDK